MHCRQAISNLSTQNTLFLHSLPTNYSVCLLRFSLWVLILSIPVPIHVEKAVLSLLKEKFKDYTMLAFF